MAKSILLVEENQQLAAAIVDRLTLLVFDVSHVGDGITALRAIVPICRTCCSSNSSCPVCTASS